MRTEGSGQLYLGGICFITDRSSCSLTCLEMARLALQAGIRWVQYRDKERDRLGLYRQALRLRELTRQYGACLIINDYADIAASVDAEGVHLGQGDLPVREAKKVLGKEKLVGVSTHSLAEAVRAEQEGADYIGFGPVFSTRTKAVGPPRGVPLLQRVRRQVRIPVVAIGGIRPESLDPVLFAGARAVAAASAILRGGDITRNAASFLERIGRFGKS